MDRKTLVLFLYDVFCYRIFIKRYFNKIMKKLSISCPICGKIMSMDLEEEVNFKIVENAERDLRVDRFLA